MAAAAADSMALVRWQRFFRDPAAAAVEPRTVVLIPEQPVVTVGVSSSSSLILSACQAVLPVMAGMALLLRIA